MIKSCLCALNLKKTFFNYLMEICHYIYMRILDIAVYIQSLHHFLSDMNYQCQKNGSILNSLVIEYLLNRHLDLCKISRGGARSLVRYSYIVRRSSVICTRITGVAFLAKWLRLAILPLLELQR